MSDEFKPMDKVTDRDGYMVQLVTKIDDDRWVVFDFDLDDEVVCNVRARGMEIASRSGEHAPGGATGIADPPGATTEADR
jgi:hypothetical protein